MAGPTPHRRRFRVGLCGIRLPDPDTGEYTTTKPVKGGGETGTFAVQFSPDGQTGTPTVPARTTATPGSDAATGAALPTASRWPQTLSGTPTPGSSCSTSSY